MTLVVRENLQEHNEKGANLCMLKDCDAKTKNIGEFSYKQAIIKGFLHNFHVKICHQGALAKLGGHYVNILADICRLNAIQLDVFVDGDLSEKNIPPEEIVRYEKLSTNVTNK